ncbi:MAG: hypothetical protein Q4F74_06215, partial [Synergistaceae bacterium]|nr:hypothetical protein [Synergistaceae bacterium]
GMALMIIGLACISMLTATIAHYMMYSVNKQDAHLDAIIKDLENFSNLSENKVEEICDILKTMKKHRRTEAAAMHQPPQFAASSNPNDWRNGRFAKWARNNFTETKKDEFLIEEKISGTSDN